MLLKNGLQPSRLADVALLTPRNLPRIGIQAHWLPSEPCQRGKQISANKTHPTGHQHRMQLFRHRTPSVFRLAQILRTQLPNIVLCPTIPEIGNCRTKLTNKPLRCPFSAHVTLMLLWFFSLPPRVAVQKDNFRRLLRTVEALSDLGPQLAAEREFSHTARLMLTALLEAAGAREGALFTFSDRPSLLTSTVAQGFTMLPDPAVIPLLPKHVHTLTAARGPVVLNTSTYEVFLSSNGNVAPELFKCIAPLKVAGKLVGLVALGRREDDAVYDDEELDALALLASYVALAVHNHVLTQSLTQRVSENLRLMASLHGFYDKTLEAFAVAIEVKHVIIHGNSLRVGRCAAAIGEALSKDSGDLAALRSAG